MSQLSDDSLVLAGVLSSSISQSTDGSQSLSAASDFLDSQGYVTSLEALLARQACPTTAGYSLLADLALSGDDEDSLSDSTDLPADLPADPQPTARLSRTAKGQRKKIGRRAPAKLSSSDAPPLRRATAPNLITSRRARPPVDISAPPDDPRIRKNS